MKTAPKGKIPASSILGKVFMYQTWDGMGRGILFVRTLYSYGYSRICESKGWSTWREREREAERGSYRQREREIDRQSRDVEKGKIEYYGTTKTVF